MPRCFGSGRLATLDDVVDLIHEGPVTLVMGSIFTYLEGGCCDDRLAKGRLGVLSAQNVS